MIQTRTRNVAKKYSIEKLNFGTFVVSENFEEPNYLQIGNDKVNRTNIIGTIVDKTELNGREVVTIDDGSKMTLRTFSDLDFSNLNVGDVVLVIGRPRSNNEGVFVAVESISKVDPKWIIIRQQELEYYEKYYKDLAGEIAQDIKIDYDNYGTSKKEDLIEDEESIISESSVNTLKPVNKDDPKLIYSKILEFIEILDVGEGANFIDVLTKLKEDGFDLEKTELMINKMILDGEIFEIQGNLKISK